MNSVQVNYKIVVSGRVQGVGFRYATKEKALLYNLTGHVCNLINGDVLIEVSGKSDQVDAFIKWCKRGPNPARVDHIEIAKIDTFEAEAFYIKR